jgi:predicted MPP superfamily phosphohydrolase
MVHLDFRHSHDWRALPRQPRRVERTRLATVNYFGFPVEDCSLSGRRLIFFTDLHYSARSFWPGEAFVEIVNNLRADWLAFGGDLIRFLADQPAAMEMLGKLRARRKKLAVPGNRERMHSWISPEAWRQRFQPSGFQLLINESWQDPLEASPVFVGLDDLRKGRTDVTLLETFREHSGPVICLSHTPDTVVQAKQDYLGDLVLAGHTHGGQIRIPGLGAIYASSHYGTQFAQGWFRRDGGRPEMYVSRGLGCTGSGIFRHRFCCPPEIVVLEFESPARPRPVADPAN